jgi:hypothetical protein
VAKFRVKISWRGLKTRLASNASESPNGIGKPCGPVIVMPFGDDALGCFTASGVVKY